MTSKTEGISQYKLDFIRRTQKQITVVLAIFVAAALILNLGLLTVLGTKGQEISNVRTKQEETKLSNDILRSQLEALKVNRKIEKIARDKLNMRNVEMQILDPNVETHTAEN